jgi:hypothetical protein
MVTPRILQIALSFVVAGAWISSATLAGERLGSRLAGLITNLPSTIVVAMLFVALTRGTAYAAAAAASVSIGMGLCVLFLLAFIVTIPRGLGVALGASFGAWLLAAWLVSLMPPPSLARGFLLYLLATGFAMLVLRWLVSIPPAPRRKLPFRLAVVAGRALFAGAVVAGAVTAAQLAPPFLAGILSCFPAMYSSSLVILTRSQGAAFARASGRVMILSSSSIIVYAVAVGILFPRVGIWLGTLLAFALAALYLLLLARFARNGKDALRDPAWPGLR